MLVLGITKIPQSSPSILLILFANGIFSPTIFVAPGAWTFLLLVFFCTLLYSKQCYTLHSILLVFMGFCCENKVWALGAYDIPHPQGMEPTTLESYPSTGTCFNRLRDFHMVYPMILGPIFCTSCIQ